jgi:hypothetical protein
LHNVPLFKGGSLGIIQSNGPQWMEQRRAVLRILRNFGLGKNQVQRILYLFNPNEFLDARTRKSQFLAKHKKLTNKAYFLDPRRSSNNL